jgi:dCTP deaminase
MLFRIGVVIMGLKADCWIDTECQNGMITPYSPYQKRQGIISYGTTSYGYDMRISNTFKVINHESVVDPKNISEDDYNVIVENDVFVIPRHTSVLAMSMEYFKMPPDVLGVVIGKSTYARCHLIVNCTPLEPSWQGYLTIELTNPTSNPIKIYVGEGIAQVIFLKGDEQCLINYSNKNGKYQNQVGVTIPIVE